MTQIGLGTMGFFIIHPKKREPTIDRDFAIFLNEWAIPPGTARPNPNVMTDFDIFTFNSRVFPGTESPVARTGDRVRIRIGSVSQESHPIHLHGHKFKVVTSIRRADVRMDIGWVVLELEGEEIEVQKGLDWIMSKGVRVDPVVGDVVEG